MNPVDCLATFVHISDLHIGDLDPETGEAVHAPWLQEAWTEFPHFAGLAGHDLVVMRDLVEAWRKIRDGEKARLILTGDLTAYGSAEQYTAAVLFLTDAAEQWQLLGLEVKEWAERGIAGNHDHWGGTFLGLGPNAFNEAMRKLYKQLERMSASASKLSRFVGFLSVPFVGLLNQLLKRPTPAVAKWLRRFPVARDPDPLPGTDLSLRWLAVDTDSGVSALSPARLLARGSFCRQLDRLRAKLGPAAPREIRVLLLHHSPAYADTTHLRIDAPSRKALARFVADCNVRVLLTGHIHKVALDQQLNRLESRCGTTTQVPRVTLTRPNDQGKWDGQLDLNTFLVHRLFRAGRTIVWETKTHQHFMSERCFKETGAASRLVVWEPSP